MRGDDPLPAEVQIKCSTENADFFYLDPKDWYFNVLLRKVYGDSIQESIRRILGRSVLRTFGLFTYNKHNLVDVYCPTFDAPQESKILDVIDIVKYKLTQHQRTMQTVLQDLRMDRNDEEANWV